MEASVGSVGGKVDRRTSAVHLTLPFAFSRETFFSRCAAVESANWTDRRGNSVEMWRAIDLPKEEMLPQVAELLNPSDPATEATARLWQAADPPFLSRRGLSGQDPWFIEIGRTDASRIEFRIQSVQLALFHLGTGFVTFRAVLPSSDPNDWLEFLHYARLLERSHIAPVHQTPNQPKDLSEMLIRAIQTARIPPDGTDIWYAPLSLRGVLLPFAVVY